ncbi:MAG: hypothetical protein H0V30_09400 [Chitinophagaceae bacterium]|nr:hypothetical protein [Chitinophagaceae bacterium]
MKIIKVLGHPIVLIAIFLLLIIEGAHFGGFYLLYLLLAIPHGATYALLAIGGISLIVIVKSFVPNKSNKIRAILYLLGLLIMNTSLVIFFSRDEKTGNMETFEGGVPLISFIIFGVFMLCFLVNIFVDLSEYRTSLLSSKSGE